jgi:uncharacterized protein YneF (UPF0154 family)
MIALLLVFIGLPIAISIGFYIDYNQTLKQITKNNLKH